MWQPPLPITLRALLWLQRVTTGSCCGSISDGPWSNAIDQCAESFQCQITLPKPPHDRVTHWRVPRGSKVGRSYCLIQEFSRMGWTMAKVADISLRSVQRHLGCPPTPATPGAHLQALARPRFAEKMADVVCIYLDPPWMRRDPMETGRYGPAQSEVATSAGRHQRLSRRAQSRANAVPLNRLRCIVCFDSNGGPTMRTTRGRKQQVLSNRPIVQSIPLRTHIHPWALSYAPTPNSSRRHPTRSGPSLSMPSGWRHLPST